MSYSYIKKEYSTVIKKYYIEVCNCMSYDNESYSFNEYLDLPLLFPE